MNFHVLPVEETIFFFFFFKLILSFLPTEFYDCYFDQEPNVFEENKFLWVLSSPFPCSCKSLKLGGANTFITQRPYKPFRFFFTPFFTTNASLIQDIFGCNLTSKLYFHIPTCIPNCWAPFPCISSSFLSRSKSPYDPRSYLLVWYSKLDTKGT